MLLYTLCTFNFCLLSISSLCFLWKHLIMVLDLNCTSFIVYYLLCSILVIYSIIIVIIIIVVVVVVVVIIIIISFSILM